MIIVINLNCQTTLNLNKLKLCQNLFTVHILIFNNWCLHHVLNWCWFILRKQVSQVTLHQSLLNSMTCQHCQCLNNCVMPTLITALTSLVMILLTKAWHLCLQFLNHQSRRKIHQLFKISSLFWISAEIEFESYAQIWRFITWKSQFMFKILSSSVIQLINLSCTISTFLNQLKKIENSESFTTSYSVMNLIQSLLQLLLHKLHKSLFCKHHNLLQLSQSCHTKTELLTNSFKNNLLTNQHLLSV